MMGDTIFCCAGWRAFALRRSLRAKKLYRKARCELLHDIPLDDFVLEASWRQTLIEKAPSWFSGESEAAEQFRKLLDSDLALGALADIHHVSRLPLDAEFKQSLLEELSVETRLNVLHDFLEGKKNLEGALKRKFPSAGVQRELMNFMSQSKYRTWMNELTLLPAISSITEFP